MRLTRLVVYDISKDKLRRKLAERLEQIGFTRVQKSVFLGKVKRKVLQAVIQRFESRLEKTDRLYVIPLRDQQVLDMYRKGMTEDLALVLDLKKSVVL